LTKRLDGVRPFHDRGRLSVAVQHVSHDRAAIARHADGPSVRLALALVLNGRAHEARMDGKRAGERQLLMARPRPPWLRAVAPRPAVALGTAFAVFVGATTSGCATAEYRVPAAEVVRLAQIPPPVRGSQIRVIPADRDVAPPPPPPPVVVVEAPPPPVAVEVGVGVGVGGGGRGPTRPVGPASGSRLPSARPPIAAPGTTASTGWHPTSAPGPGSRAPSGGGLRRGGGGGGGEAAAAVAVVGLIVLIAAASDAAAEAARAKSFDGWVRVAADHPLRLVYGPNVERSIPLSVLTPSDVLGLSYAVLNEDAGHVETLAPPPPAPPMPAPAPPPPMLAAPPAPVAPSTPPQPRS
jgi:hypothetical protein